MFLFQVKRQWTNKCETLPTEFATVTLMRTVMNDKLAVQFSMKGKMGKRALVQMDLAHYLTTGLQPYFETRNPQDGGVVEGSVLAVYAKITDYLKHATQRLEAG
jgi:hypothetical protein